MTDHDNLEAILELYSRRLGMEPCWNCNGLGGKELPDGALDICLECCGMGELPRIDRVIGVEVRHPEGEPHRILIEG